MVEIDSANYVAKNPDGTFKVVVNGKADPYSYPTQSAAEDYYNNVTTSASQRNGNATIIGGGPQQLSESDKVQRLKDAHYPGPWDQASVDAAYARTATVADGGTGQTGGPSTTAGLEMAPDAGTLSAIRDAATLAYNYAILNQVTLPGLQLDKDKVALQAAAQAADTALRALTLEGTLTGPRNAFTEEAVQHGLNAAGISNYFASLSAGGPALPAVQGQSYAPQPISVNSLIGDTYNQGGFQAPGSSTTEQQIVNQTVGPGAGAAGAAPGPTTVTAQQVQAVATGLNIPASMVQAYVNAKGVLPPNPADLNSFLDSAGLRNPTTGALNPAAQAAAAPAAQPAAQSNAQTAAPAAPAQGANVAPTGYQAPTLGARAAVQQYDGPQHGANPPFGGVYTGPQWLPPSTDPTPAQARSGAPGSPGLPASMGGIAAAPATAPKPPNPSIYDAKTGATNYAALYDQLVNDWNANPANAGKSPGQADWSKLVQGQGIPALQADSLAGAAWSWMGQNGNNAPTRDQFVNLAQGQHQNWLNSLPQPSQINPVNFMRGSQSDQQMALGGYAQKGYDPTDVQNTVKNLLPQFNAPSYGSVG